MDVSLAILAPSAPAQRASSANAASGEAGQASQEDAAAAFAAALAGEIPKLTLLGSTPTAPETVEAAAPQNEGQATAADITQSAVAILASAPAQTPLIASFAAFTAPAPVGVSEQPLSALPDQNAAETPVPAPQAAVAAPPSEAPPPAPITLPASAIAAPPSPSAGLAGPQAKAAPSATETAATEPGASRPAAAAKTAIPAAGAAIQPAPLRPSAAQPLEPAAQEPAEAIPPNAPSDLPEDSAAPPSSSPAALSAPTASEPFAAPEPPPQQTPLRDHGQPQDRGDPPPRDPTVIERNAGEEAADEARPSDARPQDARPAGAPSQRQEAVAAGAPITTPVTGQAAPTTAAPAVATPGLGPVETAVTGAAEAAAVTTRPPEPVFAPRPPAHAQVGEQIVRRIEGGGLSFEMRLDPPELGQVTVKLEMSGDGGVRAHVGAETPAALAELVRNARDLERTLTASGLRLEGQGLTFDLNDRPEGRQSSDRQRDPRRDQRGEPDIIAPAPVRARSLSAARIDLLA